MAAYAIDVDTRASMALTFINNSAGPLLINVSVN